MKVFLDTNILIDFLTQRQPAAREALEIFKAIKDGVIVGALASFSVINAIYILDKTYKIDKVISVVEAAVAILILLPTSDQAIRKAMKAGNKDFEDSAQYFTALEAGNIDYIITRDKKGFSKSEIPVLTPHQFINKYLKK